MFRAEAYNKPYTHGGWQHLTAPNNHWHINHRCISTTDQPAPHRERNHHDFTPQPSYPAAGRSARRRTGTERMRFQLLPVLRIGVCEWFGERICKHRRYLGKRIRECFGIC